MVRCSVVANVAIEGLNVTEFKHQGNQAVVSLRQSTLLTELETNRGDQSQYHTVSLEQHICIATAGFNIPVDIL